MSDSDEVLQLRACRAELERIKKKLGTVRHQQAEPEEKADSLLAQQREPWKKRKAAVLATRPRFPVCGSPRRSALPCGNLYKLLEGENDES